MPLIVLCGRPSSGKTTRAMELKTYLEGISKMPVVVLNEESLGLDRNSSYADNVKEKEFRGFFRSHVEKNLNQQTIVIVDTLNYIKGVRYEYYCLARTAKTTYAVVIDDDLTLGILRNANRRC
jgi:protein KTI12